MIIAMSLGLITNVAAQVKTSDSTFVNNSRPIEFIVNKTFMAHPIYLGGNFLILQKIYTFVP